MPFPLADKANPSDTSFVPVPEWYFLFYYELLKHIHGPFEPLVTWVLPLVFVLIVLFWPLLDWRKTVRAPASRPIGMALGAVFLLIVFSLLGVSLKNLYAVKRADPGVAHGKVLYTQFGCAGCHRIHGEGGALAPDLSFVGDARTDREWHVKHFRDPQSVSPGSYYAEISSDRARAERPDKLYAEPSALSLLTAPDSMGGISLGAGVKKRSFPVARACTYLSVLTVPAVHVCVYKRDLSRIMDDTPADAATSGDTIRHEPGWAGHESCQNAAVPAKDQRRFAA